MKRKLIALLLCLAMLAADFNYAFAGETGTAEAVTVEDSQEESEETEPVLEDEAESVDETKLEIEAEPAETSAEDAINEDKTGSAEIPEKSPVSDKDDVSAPEEKDQIIGKEADAQPKLEEPETPVSKSDAKEEPAAESEEPIGAEENGEREILVSGTCGENLTWELGDEGLLVISGTGKMEDFKAPSVPWKAERESITSVVIGNGVTSIGEYAFFGCSNLTSAAIPDSITSIGNEAFNECSSLTNVEMLTGVTTIGNQVFNGCTSLTEIAIPNSVTSMGWGVFGGCSSLTRVTLPNMLSS